MNEPPISEPRTVVTQKWKGVREVWWPKLKIIGTRIIKLTELVAALVVVVAWFPLAWDVVNPNFKEYETLKALYAGASVSLFDGKLGPPSIVRAVATEPGITERLYVKNDYVVQTLATAEGETKLYSVLSCSPNFKPSFTGLGGRVTLQDKPLAEQMRPGQEPQNLYFLDPAVAINRVYFELAIDASAPSHYRGYGYGVNTACSTGSKGAPLSGPYEGPLPGAPQQFKSYRATVPANFYVEAWERPIRKVESGFPKYSLVTPLPESLPPGWPKS